MEHTQSTHSSLFLMELIISILLFSLVSITCIQLFMNAILINKGSQEQLDACMASENVAEIWLASDLDTASHLLVGSQLTEDGLVYFYDDSHQLLCMEDGTGNLNISSQNQNGKTVYEITIYKCEGEYHE